MKSSHLIYYKRLSEFFRQHFPQIKVAAELEKEILIDSLLSSPSFADTHLIVGKLATINEFSDAQLNAIVSAAIINDQVYRIIDDTDVKQFLLRAVKGKHKRIDQHNLDELYSLFEDDSDTDLD